MYWWLAKVRDRFGPKYFDDPNFLTVEEFIVEILGIGDYIWPSIKEDLKATFEGHISEVIKLDGVGSGKTTYAWLVYLYLLYLLGHTKDPAKVFGLMPGSKIALVIMSLRERQAKGLVFDEVKFRMGECSWFKRNYRYKERGAQLLEFPNRVFVLSGSSSETVPIGYNVLAGICDESDWFLKQCLASGTKLVTKSGMSEIQTLARCQDQVHNGELWEQPTKFFNHDEQPTLKVTLVNGLSLIGHPTHRIRMKEKGWCKLADLKVGDRVFVKQNINFSMPPQLQFPGVIGNRPLRKKLIIPTQMSCELAWLLGYLTGDGCIINNGAGEGVSFFYAKEEEGRRIVSWMENLFGLRDPKEIRENGHKYARVIYYSVELRTFFEWAQRIFLESCGAFYSSWITGFIQADGCRDRVYHVVEQRDEDRIRDAFYMALSLGWAPTLRRSKHKLPGKDETRLYWKLRMRTPKDLDLIGKNHDRDWKPVNEQEILVESVQKSEVMAVYDLTMPATHQYLSNFIVSHNSHVGDSLDQAENVYSSMKDRIESRFGDRGLIILVSSARNPEGFMVKRWNSVQGQPDVFTTRRPYWESKPGKWAPFFTVKLTNCSIVEENVQTATYDSEYFSVPMQLMAAFNRNPRRFMRNRASVVTISDTAYVLRPDAIAETINWMRPNPVLPDGTIDPAFRPIEGQIYYSHNDLGYSRDTCASSIGHQVGLKTVIDMAYLIDPKEEGKVDFERVRSVFFELKNRGFNFGLVTFDHFQSLDTMQRLERAGFPVEHFSVDADMRAYNSWLEASYCGELDMVPLEDAQNPFKDYMFNVRSLLVKGKKVDHRKTGAKDITDSVAGTTHHCRTLGMGSVVKGYVARRNLDRSSEGKAA